MARAPRLWSIVGKRYIIHARAVDNILVRAQMTEIPVQGTAEREIERVEGGIVVDGSLVEEIAAVKARSIEAR